MHGKLGKLRISVSLSVKKKDFETDGLIMVLGMAHLLIMLVGVVMGSILSPNIVILKEVKRCTCCCYVRYTTIILRVRGMP